MPVDTGATAALAMGWPFAYLERMDKEPLRLVTAEPPGREVVEQLEKALERARRGEISSIAIAFVDREGICVTGWSTPPSMGLLVGATSALLDRLHRKWAS